MSPLEKTSRENAETQDEEPKISADRGNRKSGGLFDDRGQFAQMFSARQVNAPEGK